jgi:DNA-binding transcriptional regulator YiaG
MTEQQKQEIIQELKDYIDSILKPFDNEKIFPLKYIMHKYELSQSKVASQCVVSVQTVHRWLHNKQRISDKHLRNLHQILAHYEWLEQQNMGDKRHE